MFIYIDKALEDKIGVVTVDDKEVNPKPRGSSKLFDNENEYPMISYSRIGNSFDSSRYDSQLQEVVWNSEYEDDPTVPPNSYLIFEPTRPYNLMYQVDCVARDLFGIDMLELHMDKSINPIGDFLSFIGNTATEDSKEFHFDIKLMEKRSLDDLENQKFRRVYTYIVRVTIDFDIKMEDVSYLEVT